jgi:hypothetical protein
MIERYVFGPFPHGVVSPVGRADLEFYGINQFRPSFVALIFFNDTEVDADSASEDRPSYAGSFAMFGHPTCFGGEGHCVVHEHTRRFDDRPSHPLTRAFKRVVVTEALQRCVDSDELTVTVVASTAPDATMPEEGSLLDLEGMQLSTFEWPG